MKKVLKKKNNGWTPEEMIKVLTFGTVSPSPDGRKVLYTVIKPLMTGEKSKFLTHIHITDRFKKVFFQLTRGDNSSTLPGWSPDGKLIAFLTDRGGDKKNIWLIRPDGGEVWQLTDVKTEVDSFIWSPDGKKIAFIMKDPLTEEEKRRKKEKNDAEVLGRNLKNSHIYIVFIRKNNYEIARERKLTNGNFNVCALRGNRFSDWSPDGKEIVFTHTKTSDLNDYITSAISKVEVKTGKITPLLNTEACEYFPLYSPDGKWIAFISSIIPSKIYDDLSICIVPSKGGSIKVLPHTFNRFMTLLGWSKNSKYIYFRENKGVATLLSKMPVDGKAPVDIIDDARIMDRVSINRTSSIIGFTSQDFLEPEEVYIMNLKELKPLKVSKVNGKIPSHSLGKSEIIKWKAIDGMEIEGFLTYPAGYKKGEKYPLLLIIHGGPPAVFRKDFIAGPGNYPIAAFSSQGYLILGCNVRGSDGYGPDFRKANVMDLGGMDFQDLMSGVDYLIRLGIADENRMGLMGRSYGGYLAAWALTQTKRFRAVSVGCGSVNFISEQGTTDLKNFSPDYWRCQFWENPDLYINRSPIFNIKDVSTPVLIQHGEKDLRVPLSQSYELYNALKEQNVPVEMVIYPRTGHGAKSEPKLLIDMMKRNIEWFQKYVMEDQ